MAECVKWVKAECVQWAETEDGKPMADLTKCPVEIKDQAREFSKKLAERGMRFRE